MSEVLDAPRPATLPAPADEAAALCAVREETERALLDEGMLPELARQGAHWRLLFHLLDTAFAPTLYDAEARLHELHILPSLPVKHTARWSSLRPGDIGSPGARAYEQPSEEPEKPPPGWTPAERAQMNIRQKLPILDLWRECHGRAAVRPEDIDQRVRVALAGSKVEEWTDADFGSWFHGMGVCQLGDGILFQPVREGNAGPTAFKADYWPRNRWPDPKDAAWKARNATIRARADELRDDPAFCPAASFEDRMMEADGKTFREAVAALAEERGIHENDARKLFYEAGIR